MKFLASIAVVMVLAQAGAADAPPLSAESEAFRKLVLRQQPLLETQMAPAERLPAYAKYDFSPLWLELNDEAVYGFIGPNYQRLRVRLVTIQKSADDPTRYLVTGKTQILGILRTFRGTIRLQQVREAYHRQLPPPGEGFTTKVAASGNLVARYDLLEDSTQGKTGVFRGVLATYWYTDNKLRLHYDAIEGYSDGFTNNQFVGTWTSYATGKSLRCNWGDYRIPNSGDFDIGAGFFIPADKYLANGWRDVSAMEVHGDEAARRREARAWWK